MFAISVAFAQLRYPVVGTYKRASMQGMAIYGDYAYLMNDGGICRVYDLREQTVANEFMLGSADEKNHANSASFGWEVPEGGTNPAIYISKCREPYCCYVENISVDGSQLIQTISADVGGKPMPVADWVVDPREPALYSITRTSEQLDSIGTVENIITKFPLPRLADGNVVVLTDKDVLDRFSVYFPNILQGAAIYGNSLYIATGLQQSVSHRRDARRALKVVDLKKRRLVKDIDLTYLTTLEPEGVDFYKGKAMISCGEEGGLWEVKIK